MGARVLGVVDVDGPGLSPRERVVLAALIVRRDSAASASELADALWGDDLPVTWRQQVRNAVARVRGKLGAGAVQTVGERYRLGLDPQAIDSVEFERLVARARGHVLDGAADRAVAEYQRALGLWRGRAYEDAGEWPPIAAEARRLDSVRLSADEELLDARLLAGETATVIPDAERLVREDPLRERRWATLATAHYRADRQIDALAVLRDAREQLAEEYGVEPSPRLARLETDILRQAPDLAVPLTVTATALDDAAACPYRGLSAYQGEDRLLFFGRDADTDALLVRTLPRSVVAIVGPSGSGKSSLVRAGLLPRLSEQGRDVRIVVPTQHGLSDLETVWDSGADVVCIDQAEELVGATPATLDAFGRSAADWVANGGCLVLTVRSDFLDRAVGLDAIGPAIGQGLYALAPLDEPRLREAIVGPAEATGAKTESGLVEIILRDAAEHPGILPALSYALASTWRHREGATLTIDAYEESGGIVGAIAQSAEQVYHALDDEGQQVCQALMMRLVERTPEGDAVRRRVPLAVIASDPTRRAVIERLVAARLVTVDDDAVLLTHEAVARTWPRLEGWLIEGAESAALLRSVESAAVAWAATERPAEDLWRGGRLHAAIEWRDSAHPELTDVEAAFLDAAVAQQRDDVRELAERARKERLSVRRLRLALAGVAAFLVVSLVLGTVAVVRSNDAQAAAEEASIEALAATSLAVRDTDTDLAALLAAELYRRWPADSRSRSALLGATQASGGRAASYVIGNDPMMAGAVIPGTRTAALVVDPFVHGDGPEAGSQPGKVWVMNLDTGEVVKKFQPALAPLDRYLARRAFVSADGSTLVVFSPAIRESDRQCCTSRIDAIDVASGVALVPTIELEAPVAWNIALADDGSVAYVLDQDVGAPVRLDLRTGDVRRGSKSSSRPAAHTQALALVGDEVIVGGESSLAVYAADTLKLRRSLSLPRRGAADSFLLVDKDGGIFAFGNEGAVRLDSASGKVAWDRPSDADPCEVAALAGGVLLCQGWNGSIAELETKTGLPTGRSFVTATKWGSVTQFLGDSGEFVTFSLHRPAAVATWRLDGLPSTTRLVVPGGAATGGFGVNDTLLITAPYTDDPSKVRQGLWDLKAGAQVGKSSDVLRWLSDEVVARAEFTSFEDGFPRESSFTLERVADPDSPPYGLDLGVANQRLRIYGGGSGPHGFALFDGRAIAFDAATGKRVGVDVPLDYLSPLIHTWSVAEVPGTTRFLAIWWNVQLGRVENAVYDFATGKRVAHAGDGDESAIGLPGGDVLSTGSDRFQRRTSDLVPVSALPNPVSKPVHLNVDASGETLLTQGNGQEVSLYDLAAGRRLGGEIRGKYRPEPPWPGAYLSAGGTQMVTSVPDGVMLWELEPSALRDAACRMAGRNLSDVEWRAHFGDEPYVKTCADFAREYPLD